MIKSKCKFPCSSCGDPADVVVKVTKTLGNGEILAWCHDCSIGCIQKVGDRTAFPYISYYGHTGTDGKYRSVEVQAVQVAEVIAVL